MGKTLTSFQTSGKTHRLRQKLNILECGSVRGPAAFFSRQLLIQSGPMALELSKLFRILKTSIADTTF